MYIIIIANNIIRCVKTILYKLYRHYYLIYLPTLHADLVIVFEVFLHCQESRFFSTNVAIENATNHRLRVKHFYRKLGILKIYILLYAR